MKAEILHREKLKELGYKNEAIEDIVNKYIGDCTYEFAESYHNELSQPQDNWISVEDRLPEDSDLGTEFICSIVTPTRVEQKILEWYSDETGDTENHFLLHTALYYTEVTHWQPKPQSPKQ